MKVQVNTDHNIQGDERVQEYVEHVVADTLSRFADQLTRVVVHIGDEHAGEAGEHDMRCMMEARLAGRRPTAVTHHASTVRDAINGAADKIERVLEKEIGKLGR